MPKGQKSRCSLLATFFPLPNSDDDTELEAMFSNANNALTHAQNKIPLASEDNYQSEEQQAIDISNLSKLTFDLNFT